MATFASQRLHGSTFFRTRSNFIAATSSLQLLRRPFF
jgi:hypothetical protein